MWCVRACMQKTERCVGWVDGKCGLLVVTWDDFFLSSFFLSSFLWGMGEETHERKRGVLEKRKKKKKKGDWILRLEIDDDYDCPIRD